jgi:hypothetical protein
MDENDESLIDDIIYEKRFSKLKVFTDVNKYDILVDDAKRADINTDVDLLDLNPTSLLNMTKYNGSFDHIYQNVLTNIFSKFTIDSNIDKFKLFITSIEKYNEKKILSAESDGIELPFIMKYDDNIINEAFVGSYINLLRNRIPNFVHTYASFLCSEKSENGKISICDNPEEKQNFIILEKLYGKTLHNYLKDNSDVDVFVSGIIQILNALNIAYKEFDFTHYDLHTGNIIVEELDELHFIPILDGKYYLNTMHIFKIIDFGHSHIKIQGISSGITGYEGHSIYNNISNPMYDVVKLLQICYDNCKDPSLKNAIADIYAPIGNINDRTFINKKYLYPLDNKRERYSDILNHVLKLNYSKYLISNEPKGQPTICENGCLDSSYIISKLFTTEEIKNENEDTIDVVFKLIMTGKKVDEDNFVKLIIDEGEIIKTNILKIIFSKDDITRMLDDKDYLTKCKLWTTKAKICFDILKIKTLPIVEDIEDICLNKKIELIDYIKTIKEYLIDYKDRIDYLLAFN